ncbi:1-acyl-sn-glycerol-3-phosphate acyltransferase [Candidatus Photodesmus blepharus]|uniref:1-acyl-sn-glycerol-3-phosphate acyltransferase n=2 Tax=Candidatus Photodesmus blepharonis TaxID=1179155 RepID=A0A084CM34_9GAMM|nr:1-acyl-sn-glycerol-3-phosphate acyltransferase [Candidatus Photodesmus blepharus]
MLRMPEDAYHRRGQYVYIANHQNNWDMFTVSSAVTPKVVTVGKKSLIWIPLFGQLYWLSGNILINRANRFQAIDTIEYIVNRIKRTSVSVWMFPEGTRSRGRGLLPFKNGAFYAAIFSGVPIVPIVCSSTSELKLNRWRNGYVIVEMLPPISTKGYNKESVRELVNLCHHQMRAKLALLDEEVNTLNQLSVAKN